MEQHEEVARATKKDPVEPAPAVTSQLAKARFNLGALRKGQRRGIVREAVHFFDLDFDEMTVFRRDLGPQKFPDRLSALPISVEHRLRRHPPLRAGARKLSPLNSH